MARISKTSKKLLTKTPNAANSQAAASCRNPLEIHVSTVKRNRIFHPTPARVPIAARKAISLSPKAAVCRLLLRHHQHRHKHYSSPHLHPDRPTEILLHRLRDACSIICVSANVDDSCPVHQNRRIYQPRRHNGPALQILSSPSVLRLLASRQLDLHSNDDERLRSTRSSSSIRSNSVA